MINIIILNYNNWTDTVECISSVLNGSYQEVKIIVVDNHSTNESEAQIKKFLSHQLGVAYTYYNVSSPEVLKTISGDTIQQKGIDQFPYFDTKFSFIQTGKNLGFAGGNNVALNMLLKDPTVDASSGIFLLNPDTTIHTKALSELAQINKTNFIAGCKIMAYKQPEKVLSNGAFYIDKFLGTIRPVDMENENRSADYIYGAALYTNKDTVIKNGLLPEQYFLYWEETDWCYRAKQNGIDLITCQSAIIYDKVGSSIGRGYLAQYYYIRNGLYFFKKHYGGYVFSFFINNLARSIGMLIKGKFKKAQALLHGTQDFIKNKTGNKVIG